MKRLGHGIPSVLTLKGETWRVSYGIPRRHRCKGKREKCDRWTGPNDGGVACSACQRIIIHPAVLKDPVEAWRVFAHEAMHAANFGVAHKHIIRLECGLGEIMRGIAR